MGENPAVGSANAKMQRLGMANLDWLVVRDFSLIESATWWKDGPEIETGELRTEDIAHRGLLLPGGRPHREGRQLHQHPTPAAVAPRGGRTARRRPQRAVVHVPPGPAHPRQAGRLDRPDGPPGARPDLGLPDRGAARRADAEAVLAEINGWGPDGAAPVGLHRADATTARRPAAAGSTAAATPTASTRPARRKPGTEQSWVAPEWGWAWPANRRILYNRASADPDGRPWSERKALRVVGRARPGSGPATTSPDFVPDKPPGLPAARTRPPGRRGLGGRRPVHHAGRRQGLAVRPGRAWSTDRCRPTTSPRSRPFANPLYRQQRNPVRQLVPPTGTTGSTPSGTEPGSDVFPYVATTYRLTEHHTAGGMSRWLPYLSELQPEMFCEVSPELAAERGLEHLGWATIVTARNAIEARVLVTERMPSRSTSAAGPCTRSACPTTGARTAIDR